MRLAGYDVRVMHVITGLGQGGAESQLSTLLCAGAPGMGCASVVSLLPGGVYRTTLEDAGVPVADLGVVRRRSIPLAPLRLAHLIRRFRPHILHAWMYHALLVATVALGISHRWRDTQLLWGVRCSNMDFSRYNRSLEWVVRSCGRFSTLPDAILFNSETSLAAHRELGFRNPNNQFLDNGIDTSRFRPNSALRSEVRAELGISSRVDLIAHIARVDPMKDHTTLISALGKLDRVEALLIGPDTERFATLPNIHALGPRHDVGRLLAAADLVVSSSAFGEGFPNALAEGMAAGLPAVATDVGESARIVGSTGRVVRPREPAALAEAIAALLSESRTERAARGCSARRRIETHFSITRALDAHSALYASLI